MCGIVGYKGLKKAQNVLSEGLSMLEYRGYDSAGIAYFNNGKIKITKSLGTIKNLKEKINYDDESHIGIGHTRWATHGNVELDNCHPHKVGKITLVHNGIIENYGEIKEFLINKGYNFVGQTDSEVACALIDYNYNLENDMLKAIKNTINKIIGSYAFLILNDDETSTIYATRNNSPLIVAKSLNEFYFASDVPAILKYTNKYFLLDNKDIVKVSDDLEFFNSSLNSITKDILAYDQFASDISKGNYKHFMLKEINEIDEVVKKGISPYISSIDTFKKEFSFLDNFKKIEIVACGSAYHAGLIGKSLINKYSDVDVEVEIASEYRYQKHYYKDQTLFIAISQSGETADTLAALKLAKENNVKTLGIVNVFKSSIARAADEVIYTKAGVEIAVATTKAYVSQITILALMAMYYKSKKESISKDFEDLKSLPELIRNELQIDVTSLAKKIYKEKDIYYLGRLLDYSLCMEASLKLKEISYIHSEAYASGELKHGSIALIEKNTKVIAIDTQEEVSLKTISNLKEVKSRGAYVIYITNNHKKNNDFYDEKLEVIKTNDLFQPILTIIPLQLLAYHVALLNGCNIDKPKNLAKSVTVE